MFHGFIPKYLKNNIYTMLLSHIHHIWVFGQGKHTDHAK